MQQARLIYTLNGYDRDEEWFQTSMESAGAGKFGSAAGGNDALLHQLDRRKPISREVRSLKGRKRDQNYSTVRLRVFAIARSSLPDNPIVG